MIREPRRRGIRRRGIWSARRGDVAVRRIETDYLVVGGGASAMAYVDALVVAVPEVECVVVDRRHAPGGHWLDAYPFVRLHQPSANYGVSSRTLGGDRIDTEGANVGLYERATAPPLLQRGRGDRLGAAQRPGAPRVGPVRASRCSAAGRRRWTPAGGCWTRASIRSGSVGSVRVIENDPGRVVVGGTAAGLRPAPPRAVFEGDRTTLQYVTLGYLSWSAALVGIIEAAPLTDAERNALCPPVPFSGRIGDILYQANAALQGIAKRGAVSEIAAWNDATRLNPAWRRRSGIRQPRPPRAARAIPRGVIQVSAGGSVPTSARGERG